MGNEHLPHLGGLDARLDRLVEILHLKVDGWWGVEKKKK